MKAALTVLATLFCLSLVAAAPGAVTRMVIAEGLKLACTGIALGIIVALFLTQMLAFLLYQVAARDPLTFAGVAVLFALVAVASCYIPARRAASVDPVVALREE